MAQSTPRMTLSLARRAAGSAIASTSARRLRRDCPQRPVSHRNVSSPTASQHSAPSWPLSIASLRAALDGRPPHAARAIPEPGFPRRFPRAATSAAPPGPLGGPPSPALSVGRASSRGRSPANAVGPGPLARNPGRGSPAKAGRSTGARASPPRRAMRPRKSRCEAVDVGISIGHRARLLPDGRRDGRKEGASPRFPTPRPSHPGRTVRLAFSSDVRLQV